jgi:hypothetical protein
MSLSARLARLERGAARAAPDPERMKADADAARARILARLDRLAAARAHRVPDRPEPAGLTRAELAAWLDRRRAELTRRAAAWFTLDIRAPYDRGDE